MMEKTTKYFCCSLKSAGGYSLSPLCICVAALNLFHRTETSVDSLETFLRIGNNEGNYLLLAAHQREADYAFQSKLQGLCPGHPPFLGLNCN